jgi:hypothetical protein
VEATLVVHPPVEQLKLLLYVVTERDRVAEPQVEGQLLQDP